MNMLKNLLYLIALLFLSSCIDQHKTEVSSPQISKDDKMICFSMFDGSKSSIIQMSLNNYKSGQISPKSDLFTYYNPKFSNDNKKIIFVGKRIDRNLNTIYVYNRKSSSTDSLFSAENVYDAFLSENNNEIIYSKPDTIANYSPLVRKKGHGYDIYSFNSNTRVTKKLTDLQSYSIDGISEYKKDSVLYADDDIEGICAISKSNPYNPRIIIRNDHINKYTHQYNSPIYIARYKLYIFQDSYQIFQITANNQIKLIYQAKKIISSFCAYNTIPRILFTLEGESAFYSINMDGTNLKRIDPISP